AYLRTVIDALVAAGLPSAIVSGGGTGTHRIDAALGVFTELQVGSYVFMATLDAGFKALSTDGGSPAIVEGAPKECAFFFMGDEHSALIGGHGLKVGDRVVLSPPHCDPT